MPECQSKDKWSGTEGEAEGKWQIFPFAKVGNLMCEEPRVQRERSGGVNGNTVIGKVYRVRLGEECRKGIEVNSVLTDMKESMTECTHCADSVERALGVLTCVEGRRSKQRPLLRVSATRLRASASCVDARKLDILTEAKREAEPPIPMALTVLEMVQ